MKSSDELNDDIFSQTVRFAPLVSIDLIVRDPDRKILVGLRTNEPAKGFYFVPGGRIRKDETIKHAFTRILETEVGCQADFEDARLLGVYEHMYAENRFGHPNYGTHYVVLAYEPLLNQRPTVILDIQHSSYQWLPEAELKASPGVHPYTKAYFC